MLARMDGKSPVEYLDIRQQGIVRDLSRSMLIWPSDDPHSVLESVTP